jgi:hypothetical protein
VVPNILSILPVCRLGSVGALCHIYNRNLHQSDHLITEERMKTEKKQMTEAQKKYTLNKDELDYSEMRKKIEHEILEATKIFMRSWATPHEISAHIKDVNRGDTSTKIKIEVSDKKLIGILCKIEKDIEDSQAKILKVIEDRVTAIHVEAQKASDAIMLGNMGLMELETILKNMAKLAK